MAVILHMNIEYEYSFPGSDEVWLDATIKPGITQYESLFNRNELGLQIGVPNDFPNKKFEDLYTALTYCYGTHAIDIRGDLETYTGYTFELGGTVTVNDRIYREVGILNVANVQTQADLDALELLVDETFESTNTQLALTFAELNNVTLAGMNTAIDGKANISHTHVINDITDATTVGKSVVQAANSGAARSAIGAGTSSFSGVYTDLTSIPSTFTPSSHTHVANDISNASTIGKTILTAAAASNVRTAIFSTGSNIPDAATNAPTDAATNADTSTQSSLPTNYNLLSGVLGVADGLNTSNTQQNNLEAKHAALATAVNSNATKQNTMGSIVNVIGTKINLNFDILETNNLMAA
jgi:hypothetical protein